jgi:tetratricopeptide (TPR) repeat protein
LEQFPEVEMAQDVEVPSDPRELRSGMVDGLRELLTSTTGNGSVIVFIDDLQWADADSLAMFSALLADPRTPRMMFLATSRGEQAAWLDPEIRQIPVPLPPLDRESTHALLQSMFGASRQPLFDLEPLAETAQGNALFIKELASYVLAHDLKVERLDLGDLLRDRVARVGATGRAVLDLVAAIGAPVLETVVEKASGIGPKEFNRTVLELLQGRLLQASGSLGRERIELCHQQLRVWLWGELDVARRRELSERLASAFGREGDAAQVAALWLEAGHKEKAASHLVETGERAMKGLAFDRAAEHFTMAIKVGRWDAERKGALLARLGDALAYAGKGAEAAQQYLAAANHEPNTAASLDLYRKATAELLRSGHFDEGLRVAIEALRAAGMEIPSHSIPKLLWVRARLRMRGLSCPATPRKPVSAEAAARIDLCWALSSGLCLVDPIKGAYFQALSLLLALQEEDLPRVGRGLAGEAAWCVGKGQAGMARARHMLDQAKDIEKQLNDPHARGTNLLMGGLICHLSGEFRESRQQLEEGQTVFTKQCVGAVWELDAIRQFLMEDLFYLGDLLAFRRLITTGLRQATERGSRYAATNFRTGLANFVWLLRDDPKRARRETAEGIEGWSEQGFHVQHWNTLLANVQTELYEGQGRAAYEMLAARWKEMARSGVFHIQHTRIAAAHLRARAALSAAHQSSGKERARYLKEARRCIAILDRQPDCWAQALTRISVVGLESLQGHSDLNRTMAAIRSLQDNDLSFFAHAACVAGDKLLASGPSAMNPESSRAWMSEMGIVNPAAIARTLVPGLE